MASFGRGLGIPLPFLGCQPDALIGAYCGDASRTLERTLSHFSGLFSLVIKSAVPTTHHRAWVLLHCYCREGGNERYSSILFEQESERGYSPFFVLFDS